MLKHSLKRLSTQFLIFRRRVPSLIPLFFFDSASRSYRLVASDEDGEIINGQYVKGNIVDSTNDPAALVNGSVALHEKGVILLSRTKTA